MPTQTSTNRARWVSLSILVVVVAHAATALARPDRYAAHLVLGVRLVLLLVGIALTHAWAVAARRELADLLHFWIGEDVKELVTASDPRVFPPVRTIDDRPEARYRTSALIDVIDRWPSSLPTKPLFFLPFGALLVPNHVVAGLTGAAALLVALGLVRGVEARLRVVRARADAAPPDWVVRAPATVTRGAAPAPGRSFAGPVVVFATLLGATLVVVFLATTGRRVDYAASVEARGGVIDMAKGNIARLARLSEAPAAPGSGRLCGSAARSVPASIVGVRGYRYRAAPSEWGDENDDAGFGCLRFRADQRQRYLFDYQASPERTSFAAIAKGDLNGDGLTSSFTYRGSLREGKVVMEPAIEETNPDE